MSEVGTTKSHASEESDEFYFSHDDILHYLNETSHFISLIINTFVIYITYHNPHAIVRMSVIRIIALLNVLRAVFAFRVDVPYLFGLLIPPARGFICHLTNHLHFFATNSGIYFYALFAFHTYLVAAHSTSSITRYLRKRYVSVQSTLWMSLCLITLPTCFATESVDGACFYGTIDGPQYDVLVFSVLVPCCLFYVPLCLYLKWLWHKSSSWIIFLTTLWRSSRLLIFCSTSVTLCFVPLSLVANITSAWDHYPNLTGFFLVLYDIEYSLKGIAYAFLIPEFQRALRNAFPRITTKLWDSLRLTSGEGDTAMEEGASSFSTVSDEEERQRKRERQAEEEGDEEQEEDVSIPDDILQPGLFSIPDNVNINYHSSQALSMAMTHSSSQGDPLQQPLAHPSNTQPHLNILDL